MPHNIEKELKGSNNMALKGLQIEILRISSNIHDELEIVKDESRKKDLEFLIATLNIMVENLRIALSVMSLK